MLRFIIPIGLFATLAVFLFVGLSRDKETLPSPLIGKAAPLFDLPRVEEPAQKISNREFAGRPYVVNIWGTWCFACREEHPALMEIARRGEVSQLRLTRRATSVSTGVHTARRRRIWSMLAAPSSISMSRR
jgi:cytochrome c biogenesis protein CcmG/thiol:disulfide interchange protein DsbE